MTQDKNTLSTDSLLHETRTFPPSKEVVARALLDAKTYQAMYERSIKEPKNFWLEQAETLDWSKKPTVARKYAWDTKARKIELTWFEDGELNVSTNCLDRHLKTERRTKPAIIWHCRWKRAALVSFSWNVI